MKRLIFIPFLFVTLLLSATNYYIKSGGNDNASGTSDATAWATISKVNSFWSAGDFAPGDSILFRRGDTWYGTIVVSESGTSSNAIVIGAYGTGNKPVITGFSTLSNWSLYSGSIYQATVTGAEAQTNMVVVDNVHTAMGRYPDAGWLTYTTATSSSITDPTLQSSPNWTGAEAVINKNYWTVDRCLITSHSGAVINFSNLGSTQGVDPNRRYFIQNDLRCVTATNEWYHDYSNNVFYIYGNPSSKNVKIATLNRLIYCNEHDYIHILNLNLTGAIANAIHFNGSADNNKVEYCDIGHAGDSPVMNYGGNFFEGNHNNISHSNFGFYLVGNDNTVRYNNLSYIGMVVGSSFRANTNAIFINNLRGIAEYNNINYCGYNGISSSSISTFTIHRNFINYPCLIIDDGGGIYCTSSSGTRVISENIVLNSGVGSEDWIIIPRGIYYDAGGSGATIRDNIIAGCKGAGLLIHYGDNHTITGNLLYNNQRQAEFLKYGTGVSTGIAFNNNKLIAKASAQVSLRSLSYTTDEIKAWGNFDYNYYARPVDDDNHFYYASGYHTLAEWKALVTPDDAHSYGSPVPVSSEDHIHFIYNNTLQVKIYYLSAAMKDITGTDYTGTIQLQPWTAIVLLGAGTISEEPPAPPGEEFLKKGTVLLKSRSGNLLRQKY